MQCINSSENLDKAIIFGFLEDAAEIGVKGISFVSDGESTCNPNLKDSIVYGKWKVIRNGYGIRNQWISAER